MTEFKQIQNTEFARILTTIKEKVEGEVLPRLKERIVRLGELAERMVQLANLQKPEDD